MKANGTNNGCSRLNTPLAATTTLEDPGTPASWKGPPPGSEASPFTPNSVNQGGGPNSGPYNSTGGPPSNVGGFQGPSPFPGGAGSPAGAPPYQGPPPGSATPQYTASPAPSGSSTPGPGPPPNAGGFPPPPNNSGPPYNGPSPFGSPSGGPGQFVGRPGSSGPPFVPPGGGNPHFPSPGQPFGGPQYGMPPGSPFGPGGHPMGGPMGPGHPAMMGPGGPVDRMDQGSEEGNMQAEQLNALIYYMQAHDKFAANQVLGCNSKQTKKMQWDKLAAKISTCGPTKNAKQLKACWASLKSKAKSYNAKKVKALNATGNNALKIEVNPLLEKVLTVVGTSHKNGLNIVEEVGIVPSTEKCNYIYLIY